MTSFIELGIRPDILQGLDDLGFTAPTPIQEKVIPTLLQGTDDIVALAQTGTGKTAAFGIPMLQLLEARSKKTQGLVLCPTRELCMQVARDITAIARFVQNLNILAVYGGASIEKQITELQKGVQIIIATPGRLNDLIRRGTVDISKIRTVVLDEADEMLHMGFKDELNAILAVTPETKKTLLFSATMSKEVAAIAGNYMKNPVEITVGQRNAGAENVRHIYYVVPAKNRYPALKRIADLNPDIYAIIFCRTRQETQEVADKLMQDGYNADALHGDLTQAQRSQVMAKFRRRNLQMLVATDVAARGLDVKDLTHVINYSLPDETASYTHRSGRTGRAGKDGISIAIINMREKYKLRDIEQKLKKKFEQGRIPTGREICEKQLFSLIDTVKKVEIDHEQIGAFVPTIMEMLSTLSREELVKRFVSLEFNRFLEYYRNAPDLNAPEHDKERASHKGRAERPYERESRQYKFARFFLDVGKRDGMNPKRLIDAINSAADVPFINMGKIEIMRNSTMVEADSIHRDQFLEALQYLRVNDKPVSVRVGGEDVVQPRGKFKRQPLRSAPRKGKTPHFKRSKPRA